MWTPPYCPKFQPIELVSGVGKQRASGMWFPNRDLATTRLYLRMGFYEGKDGQGATWDLLTSLDAGPMLRRRWTSGPPLTRTTSKVA